eukprot:jgi/Antlo1/1570/2003
MSPCLLNKKLFEIYTIQKETTAFFVHVRKLAHEIMYLF